MVAMNVWPTDGADGSVASEARWRKMGRIWAPSAVIAGAGGEMAPSLAMPNLTVQSGAAWVDGHYTELASNQVLTATANGLAVIRFDPAANTAELLWRDGVSTPAQSPTGTWELPIAKTVGSVLTDMRQLYRPQLHKSEIVYTELTVQRTVSSTAETTADGIIQCPMTTFDGSPILIEAFLPAIATPIATGAVLFLWLYQDGLSIGRLGSFVNPAATQFIVPGMVSRRMTPTAGNHAYTLGATVSGSTGTIFASVGGVGTYLPGYLRITRA